MSDQEVVIDHFIGHDRLGLASWLEALLAWHEEFLKAEGV